ncbi:MAG TPA: DUF4129 domain-containing protein [Anaerolineae bacterium]|nr:DUF4129 domain-containing protein [Anaerolineae bacterium]
MSMQPARSIRGGTLTAITQTLIVEAMVACMSIALVQFGQKLVATWRVDYVPFVSLGVALIAATTTRLLRQPNLPLPWYMLRGVELIALFLAARSVLGFIRGPDFVVKYDPFYGGIDNELFALVAVLGISWLLSWQLTRCLLDVAGGVPLTDRDFMQDLDNTRQAARQTLITSILSAGIVMVLFNAVIRMSLRNSGALDEAARVPVAHLLIYFGLGLILLSHTRLTVLRSGWVWERLTVARGLPASWIAATLLVLGGMALAALALPTQYSLGLFATLNYLLTLLVSIVQLIFYAIAFIIATLLSLLFPQIEAPIRPPLTLPPVVAAPQANVAPPAISEFVQSLIFWTVFLIVIGYLIYQHTRRNPVLMEALQRLPGWAWLVRWWRRLRRMLSGWSARVTHAFQARRAARSAPAARSGVSARRWINPRRLSPRDQVQFYYRALLRRGGERGLPRQPAQTPAEYARDLQHRVPEVDVDVTALTSDFVEARYSRHSIEPERVSAAQRYWARIKAALKRS